ncbi:hypothetical protein HDE_06134 [Halotydeus destructor]|nr:hypothetical protein HDE_06134 [Halotydeus destructor]
MLILPLTVEWYLISRSKHIRAVLDRFVSTLGAHKKQLLRKYSIASLVCCCFFVTCDIAIHLMWYIQLDYENHNDVILDAVQDSTWQQAVLILLAYMNITLTRRWIITTANLYVIALISWSIAFSEDVEARKSVILLDETACLDLIKLKKRFDKLKKQFNDCFAIFLFLIFAAMFIESSSLIILLKFNGFSWMNIARICFYTINMTALVMLVVAIMRIEEKESSQYQSLIEDWRSRLVDVRTDIKEDFSDTFSRRKPLDAIFFEIDKSLFLKFASSLATITVMIVQLIL